jgi:alkanesulfonate monooxygenase SsuD/methylene tetrahydromethanopterin reductase-like flavin-dependent oxidoreductase (luciferase family)
MEFGYFTLSDNHYENNRRSANQVVTDILDEAVYAEEVGLNSAWIGEHHFSSLGVLSCPDLVLAHVAARTKRIRLAPAVTVLPLHHPIRVAEQWATLDLISGGRVDFAAGRGYDRREYLPFNISFEDNQAIFEEGMEVVQRLSVVERLTRFAPRQILPIRQHQYHAAAASAFAAMLRRIVLEPLNRACRSPRMPPRGGAFRGRDYLRRIATGSGCLQ